MTERDFSPVDFPLSTFLGLRREVPEPGRALAELDLGPELHNPNGVVHGGVLFTMVDTSMGAATMSVLDDDQICASIEVHLRFLRSASTGTLGAEAEVIRRGGRIVHLRSDVRDGDDELLAVGTGSFAVLSAP